MRAGTSAAAAHGDATVGDRYEGRARLYLHPGQVFASARPTAVTTILGSCVSVCLWDECSRVGGLNHFLLPQLAKTRTGSARFGNVAMVRLVERMRELGCRVGRLTAKVFGGASVLDAAGSIGHGLGARNEELARRLLEELRIPIVGADLGGRHGRKLVFFTDDGVAWVKRF